MKAGPHPRVLQHLESCGAAFTALFHESCADPIHSPSDFARCLGWPIDRIAKTLLLKSKTNPILFVATTLPAERRIVFKEASLVLEGTKLELATPGELAEVTGYPRNSLTPLGLPKVRIVLDASLLQFETIAVGGGAIGVEVEIGPSVLAEITNAIVGKVSVA